jgi:integrase
MFLNELKSIIAKHNPYKVDGSVASYETQAKRAEVIHAGFWTLAKQGCRLKSPRQFKERHMHKLVEHWEAKGIKDIQTRISAFRTFGNIWIEKPSMIKCSAKYATKAESVKRKYVTNTDKTWSGNGAEAVTLIKKVTERDARVGIMLELGVAFGLRVKEALLLQPHKDDHGDRVHIRKGSKGGRQRYIDLEEPGVLRDYQRSVLEQAKAIIERAGTSMIPDGSSFVSYRNHVYYVLHSEGIGRARNGVSFHGLRHEYAVAYYEKQTGVTSPVKGGTEQPDPIVEQEAREALAKNLGHSRASILGCYIGSRHRPMPKSENPEPAKAADADQNKDMPDPAGAKVDPEKPGTKDE